jgi:type IV fimbrial biogenesis protein FimT
MKLHGLRGLSLVELLLCLAILAFFLVNVGTPGFSESRKRHEIDEVLQDLANAVTMARSAAINENVMVTICRSTDGQRCQGRWERGGILFTDFNADHVLNGRDRLLFRLPPFKASGTLTFNSFRNQQYLQLTPRGATNSQNGNFTFCPADGNPTLARQLIINVTARTRLAQDLDHDGIVEDSQGKPVQCK